MNQTALNELNEQFQQVAENSSPEDQIVLKRLLAAFAGKQQGQYSTYLTAALEMDRTFGDRTCSVSMPNTPLIGNSIGIPHGGILATLLDTAMGSLASSLCPDGQVAVTSNLTVHYLSVSEEETLTAEASVIRQGRQTMVIEGIIEQKDGSRVAHATGTFFVIPSRE